ncbi:hypothetical protein FALBO_252 [Fusarium albosuccineum]|uniref:Uncharacterized protein n=1 Tax=Fusarium albosuccineum TaxID=1237068 RepID=A0A8H4LQ39_9HYPO|nr:hypothetical protein FALBO_252 [Fusarium albosuccineum]
MASRFFIRLTRRPALAGGGVVAATGFGGTLLMSWREKPINATEAQIQFDTSYGYIQNGQQLIKPPEGWTGRLFRIRNDYPTLADIRSKGVAVAADLPTLPGPDTPIYRDPKDDAPWLKIDFKKNPEEYCKVIKEYYWEGNVNNDFVLQENR